MTAFEADRRSRGILGVPPALMTAMIAIAMLATGMLVGATTATADEEQSFEDRIKEHEALVKAHKTEKDYAGLVADIDAAVKLFEESKAIEDERERNKAQEKIVKLVGSLSKTREDSVAKAAILALGTMGHEDGAKYVKPHLRPVKDSQASSLTVAAIESAGKIHADSLVTPLLNMVEKSKNYTVAARAMRALGKFGSSKRYRGKILETLAATVHKSKPGNRVRQKENKSNPDGGYIGGVGGSQARWRTLGPVLPEALNELTGQRFPTAEDWFDVVKEYDGNLDVLFSDS